MHFLSKLIKTPTLEDPVNKDMDVHRHFYRYSKGDFLGPAIKISRTKSRITLKGTHEYEDVILELILNAASEDNIEIKGVLITGTDLSDEITHLNLDWSLKKSTGKTKNFKAEFTDKINKNTLLNAIKVFRKNSYLLLSFNLNPTCKVTTKKRIPQPSKKKAEDDDINARVQFCTGIMNTTEKNIKLLVDTLLKDFIAEIPDQWKSITLTNNYKITEIILPKNEKSSLMMRIKAIRKGKLFRTLELDGDLIEKQYNIVV
ncbi:MAG: hypothetical protein ACFFAO_02515 [Candidatus Hermodarchaeota archaeon]